MRSAPWHRPPRFTIHHSPPFPGEMELEQPETVQRRSKELNEDRPLSTEASIIPGESEEDGVLRREYVMVSDTQAIEFNRTVDGAYTQFLMQKLTPLDSDHFMSVSQFHQSPKSAYQTSAPPDSPLTCHPQTGMSFLRPLTPPRPLYRRPPLVAAP